MLIISNVRELFMKSEMGPTPKPHRPSSVGEEESEAHRVRLARDVYERAFKSLRSTQTDAKEEAVMLLESWKEFEAGVLCG